jgi:hypothetical protein
VTTSSGSRRLCTNTSDPDTTGDEYPSPAGAVHFFVNFSGQSAGASFARTHPSRVGPRHCPQSSAAYAIRDGVIARARVNRQDPNRGIDARVMGVTLFNVREGLPYRKGTRSGRIQ